MQAVRAPIEFAQEAESGKARFEPQVGPAADSSVLEHLKRGSRVFGGAVARLLRFRTPLPARMYKHHNPM